MIGTTLVTWPVVVLVLAVLGGTTFLGYSHDLSPELVGGVYTAVLSGGLVGHFSSSSKNGG